MLKWLIRRRIQAFEASFQYDMSYARDILAADPRALMAFSKVAAVSNYKRDVPVDVYYAVKLVGTLAEDCGPCTQLLVTMALREGVDGRTLAAILAGHDDRLSEPVRLGVEFARATLAHEAAADALRDSLVARFGRRGLVSLAFALAAARVFPTVKYALGHGRACQRVVVAGEAVPVVRAAA
jgi:hypothetical protein